MGPQLGLNVITKFDASGLEVNRYADKLCG